MSKNKVVVPEAQAALDKFKMEAAGEVGVNLKQGYNGDLTSKQAVPLVVRWLMTSAPYDLSRAH